MADSRVEHRFSVILCADVVGYSRLMGLDEEGHPGGAQSGAPRSRRSEYRRAEFSRVNWNYGAVLSIWDRLFGTYRSLSRAQCGRLVFGVRDLPRRECLKPSAMLLTLGGFLAA